jgi:hypothetical protein
MRYPEEDQMSDSQAEPDQTIDAADAAAIQDDDSLTPADKVDLMANQVVPEDKPEPASDDGEAG